MQEKTEKSLFEFDVLTLVYQYNQSEPNSDQRIFYEKIIKQFIAQYITNPLKLEENLKAIVPLAYCSNNELREILFETLLNQIKQKNLLNTLLFDALADMIVFASQENEEKREQNYFQGDQKDHLNEIINLILIDDDYLEQFQQQNIEIKKFNQFLTTVAKILNVLIALNLTDIARDKKLQLYNKLKAIINENSFLTKLKNKVTGGDKGFNSDTYFLAEYIFQAVIRTTVEKEEQITAWLQTGVEVVNGVINVVKTIKGNLGGLSELFQSVSKIKEGLMLSKPSPWFEILTRMQNLLSYGQTDEQFEQSFAQVIELLSQLSSDKQPVKLNQKEKEYLLYGLVHTLAPLTFHQSAKIRFHAIFIICKLLINDLTAIRQLLQPEMVKQQQMNFSFEALEKLIEFNLPNQDLKLQSKVLQLISTWINEFADENFDKHNTSLQRVIMVQYLKVQLYENLGINDANKKENTSQLIINTQNQIIFDVVKSKELVTQAFKIAKPVEFKIEKLKQERMREFEGSGLKDNFLQPLLLTEPQAKLELLDEKNDEDITASWGNFFENPLKEQQKLLFVPPAEIGTGESALTQFIVYQLLERFFLFSPNLFPLYIDLNTIANPRTQLVEQALKQYGFTIEEVEQFKDRCQQGQIQLLVIIDGLTKSNIIIDLYENNKLNDLKAKIIIVSQNTALEYLKKYQNIFMAPLLEYQIKKAIRHIIKTTLNDSKSQKLRALSTFSSPFLLFGFGIQSLIKKQVEQQDQKREEIVNDIYHNIQKLGDITQLIRHPFFLKVLLTILPELIDEFGNFKENLNHYQLYKIFLNKYYQQKEVEISEQYSDKIPRGFNLENSFIEYAKDLAMHFFIYQTDVIVIPDFQYQMSKKALVKDKRLLSVDNENIWLRFLSKNDIPFLSRIGAPVKHSMRTLSFLHQSFIPYYVALTLFDELNKNFANLNEIKDDINHEHIHPTCYWNLADYKNNELIFQFLSEMIANTSGWMIKGFLVVTLSFMTKYSKDTNQFDVMASNAISLWVFLLNDKRFTGCHSLTNEDFTNISIPYANLSGADLTGTDFSNANLKQVKFFRAKLNDTKFCYADLTKTEFLYLTHGQDGKTQPVDLLECVSIDITGATVDKKTKSYLKQKEGTIDKEVEQYLHPSEQLHQLATEALKNHFQFTVKKTNRTTIEINCFASPINQGIEQSHEILDKLYKTLKKDLKQNEKTKDKIQLDKSGTNLKICCDDAELFNNVYQMLKQLGQDSVKIIEPTSESYASFFHLTATQHSDVIEPQQHEEELVVCRLM